MEKSINLFYARAIKRASETATRNGTLCIQVRDRVRYPRGEQNYSDTIWYAGKRIRDSSSRSIGYTKYIFDIRGIEGTR